MSKNEFARESPNNLKKIQESDRKFTKFTVFCLQLSNIKLGKKVLFLYHDML